MPTFPIEGKSAEVTGWLLTVAAQGLPAALRCYSRAQTSEEEHGRKKLHPTLNDHYSFGENKIWSKQEPELEIQN